MQGWQIANNNFGRCYMSLLVNWLESMHIDANITDACSRKNTPARPAVFVQIAVLRERFILHQNRLKWIYNIAILVVFA